MLGCLPGNQAGERGGGGGGEGIISEQRPQEAGEAAWCRELEARYTWSDLWAHGTLMSLPGSLGTFRT